MRKGSVMKSIAETVKVYEDDVDAVQQWCDQIYAETFESYFVKQRELYTRLNSTLTPITDTELESILIDVPLMLFNVSEKIAAFNLRTEVIKMRLKERSAEAEAAAEGSQSARKEAAALQLISDQILITACTNVIQRVDREISFSRELIMGAKKIWDARRRTDSANPISEVEKPDVPVLPEYVPNAYIK